MAAAMAARPMLHTRFLASLDVSPPRRGSRAAFHSNGAVVACAAETRVVIQRVELLASDDADATSIHGHGSRVTGVGLSSVLDGVYYVCSTSANCIMVHTVDIDGNVGAGDVMDTQVPECNGVAWNDTAETAAVASGREVFIINRRKRKHVTTLDAHTGAVTCIAFLSARPDVLISTGDDRTFKIWDIASMALLYQSPILTPSALTAVSAHPTLPRFAVGSSDGKIHWFDAEETCRSMHVTTLGSVVAEAAPATDSATGGAGGNEPSEPVVVTALRTMGLDGYATVDAGDDGPPAHTIERAGAVVALWWGAHGLVVVSDALILVNDRTYELALLMRNMPTCTDAWAGAVTWTPGDANSGDEEAGDNGDGVAAGVPHVALALLWSSFEQRLFCFGLDEDLDGEGDGEGGAIKGADMVPEPFEPPFGSLLAAPTAKKKAAAKKTGSKKKAGAKAGAGARSPATGARGKAKPGAAVVDLPVSFHSKIRSSGYGTTHEPQRMFGAKKKPAAKKKASKAAAGAAVEEYPMDSPPLTESIAIRGSEPVLGGITDMAFNARGTALAVVSIDHTVTVLKWPSLTPTSFVGHGAPVRSAAWDATGLHVISASTDKSARVWPDVASGLADALLTLRHVDTGGGGGGGGSLGPAQLDIAGARFYYRDRFLVTAAGDGVHLHKYQLDETVTNNVVKKNKNLTKLAHTFHFPVQTVTAVGCLNSILSPMILVAGSNKNVYALDVSTGQCAVTLESAHDRPLHTIAVCDASDFVERDTASYNLFLTSGLDNAIKLWDLRTASCVQRLVGHTNRIHACRVAFRPTQNEVLTGSEDKRAYLYDLRQPGTFIERLGGHTDVVTCVAFHPARAVAVTGGLDGKIRLWGPRPLETEPASATAIHTAVKIRTAA